MLSRIPRMESVARMIAEQNSTNSKIEAGSACERDEIEFGIQLLRAGLAFENLLSCGLDPSAAAKKVQTLLKDVDRSILESLDDLTPSVPMIVRECSVSDLALGMILQEDLRNSSGMLLVAKGQELTSQWIERLKGFSESRVIGRRVRVFMLQNDGN